MLIANNPTTNGRLHRAEIIRRGKVIAVGYGHTPESAREDARFDLELSRTPIPGTTFVGRREWRTA